jgi:hypothetical protein
MGTQEDRRFADRFQVPWSNAALCRDIDIHLRRELAGATA